MSGLFGRGDFLFHLAVNLIGKAEALFFRDFLGYLLVEHFLVYFLGIAFFKEASFRNGFTHGFEHRVDEYCFEFLRGFVAEIPCPVPKGRSGGFGCDAATLMGGTSRSVFMGNPVIRGITARDGEKNETGYQRITSSP